MSNDRGDEPRLSRTSSISDIRTEDDDYVLFELLSRVATLYYLQDKTQHEIARQLGLSRQKVQRLLKQARDQRIVEIHVHAVPVLHLELENKIRALFGLEVIVAPSDPDPQRRRNSVARAVASYLERQLSPGTTVAVGLGRNTSTIAAFFRPAQHIDCQFVSAMGGSPEIGLSINPNDIATSLAARCGGKAVALYAPVYLETAAMRDMLLAQASLMQPLQQARHADIALMGVGTPDDESILVQAGCLSLAEARRLREIGAVGEIVGNFYDQNGNSVESELDGRLIGLSLDEIHKIGKVIVTASEIEKAGAILGALRTGAIDLLAVECQLALTVLKLAGVTDLAEESRLLGHTDGN